MTHPTTLAIDGVQYIRADSVPAPATPAGPIKIVVLDRGFVYVGHVTIDAEFVTIERAKNIRRWGTTKGLGELMSGPKAQTQLDPSGTVRAPMRAVIALVDVEQAPWTSI